MVMNLSGEVNEIMLEKLLTAFNTLQDEDLIIYFTSEGGDLHTADVIVDFINSHKDEIYMIFYSNIFSAGFKIATGVKCDKELMKNTLAMTHLGYSVGHVINEMGNMPEVSRHYLKRVKMEKEDIIEEYKNLGLTTKEIDYITSGKDLYFTLERFREIFNNSKQKIETNEEQAVDNEGVVGHSSPVA